MENQELDFEDRMTQIRLEHEEKLATMMPADIRKQLEDTIASLKMQVSYTVSHWFVAAPVGPIVVPKVPLRRLVID